MKRSEMITKKDFLIRGYWYRGMLQGQENLYFYEVVIKKTGKVFGDKFTSKREAERWLGVRIRLANKIKSGEIQYERSGK